MKKPEKKSEGKELDNDTWQQNVMFNLAIDDYEKYHNEEIAKLKKEIKELKGAGTIHRRFKHICDYTVKKGLCIGIEAKPTELFLLENYDKLETQNKMLSIRERELMEQRDKLQKGLNFYQDIIVSLGNTTLYAVEDANDLKMPTTKSLTKLIDERARFQSQLNALKEEAEKDYKDMRRFQDKYIKADSELRVLREKVESLEGEINYLYEQGEL